MSAVTLRSPHDSVKVILRGRPQGLARLLALLLDGDGPAKIEGYATHSSLRHTAMTLSKPAESPECVANRS